MKACPNINSPEWKNLVASVGEMEAYRDFYHFQNVRSTEDVIASIRNRELQFGIDDYVASNISRQITKYNNMVAKEGVVRLLDKLSSNLGVNYSYVTREQAQDMLANTGNPYNGEAAFTYKGQAYFIPDTISPDSVIHEMSHPLIDAIYQDNKSLFNSLYKEASQIPGLVAEVVDAYPDYSEEQQQKETVVFALTQSAMRNENQGLLKKIMYAIKQLLRKLFGSKISVSNLSPYTTIQELSSMIKDQEFNLPFIESQDDTVVQYIRDVNKFKAEMAAATSPVIQELVDLTKMKAASAIRAVAMNSGFDERFLDTLTDAKTDSELLQAIQRVKTNTPTSYVQSQQALGKEVPTNFAEIEKAVIATNLVTLAAIVGRAEMLLDNSIEKVSLMKGDPNVSMLDLYTFHTLAKTFGNWADIFYQSLVNSGVSRLSTEVYDTIAGLQKKAGMLNDGVVELYSPQVTDFIWNKVKDGAAKIDERYKELIDKAEGKEKEKLQKEYATRRITRESVRDTLLGKAGDLQEFNKLRRFNYLPFGHYLEAFLNNPDPVIGAFGIFMDEVDQETNRKIIEQNAEVRDKIFPLLQAQGLNNNNPQDFWRPLIFTDRITKKNMFGESEEYEVYSLLNPFKDYLADRELLRQRIEKATADQDLSLLEQLENEKAEMAKMFYNQYSDYYNETRKKFDTEIGRKALAKRDALYRSLEQINDLLDNGMLEGEIFDDTVLEKKVIEMSIKRLTSLKDEFGNTLDPESEEYQIAQVLKQHAKDTRGFYSFETMAGLFNEKLEIEKLRLEDAFGYLTPEYNEGVQKWIQENTEVRVRPEFYEYKSRLITELKQLQDSMGMGDVTGYFEELFDILAGFKNEQGEYNANELTSEALATIKALHDKIEKAKTGSLKNGLTEEEDEAINELYIKNRNGSITEEETEILQELLEKRRDYFAQRGVNSGTVTRMREIIKELSNVSSTVYSEDYIQAWNEQIDRLKNSGFFDDPNYEEYSDLIKLSLFTQGYIEQLLEDKTLIDVLRNDAKFAEWFDNNHFEREYYNKEEDAKVKVTLPTLAWTVSRPKDDTMMESFVLPDGEKIIRVPNRNYQKRILNDFHVDESGKKHALKRDRVLGKTVDVWGNWLPNLEVANNKYRNEKYFELKRNNPKLAEALDAVANYHIAEQTRYVPGARIGYQVPRFNKDAIELIQGDPSSSVFKNLQTMAVEAGREMFVSSVDDDQRGISSYNSENIAIVAAMEDETRNIPIFGLSKLEKEQVSLNVLNSMLTYHNSGIRQSGLIKTNPWANAIVETLKGNGVYEIPNLDSFTDKRREAMLNNTSMPAFRGVKKKEYDRLYAIERMYKREWLGQTIGSNSKATKRVAKLMQLSARAGSFLLFAGDIVSAFKNRGGQVLQNNIEAIAGKELGALAYAKGKRDAFIAMQESLRQSYEKGERGLRYNMMVEFNLDSIISSTKDFAHRSLVRDAIGFKWLMSPRESLQLNAGAELLFSYLHAKTIKVMKGGREVEASLFSTLEMRDGVLQSKAGTPEEWTVNGAEFKKFRRYFEGKLMRLAGNYSERKQPIASTFLWGRFAFYLRKFFYSMSAHRYAAGRIQWDTGEFETGYYRSPVGLTKDIAKALIQRQKEEGILGLFPGMGHLGITSKLSDYMHSDESDMRNALRTGADFAQIALLNFLEAYLLLFLFDFDPDDDEKKSTKRLLKATRPIIPSALMNEKRQKDTEFDLFNWIALHGIMQIHLANQEAKSFLPAPSTSIGFGEQISSIADGTFSGPFEPTLKRAGGIVLDLYGAATGDEDAFYTRDVGPYIWQDKESSKWVNKTMKMFGVDAKDVDPAQGLINTWSGEAMRRR